MEKEPLSLFDIADLTKVNFKTISHHVKRLEISGLVYKHSEGHKVMHTLSKRGKFILKFVRTLE